MPKCSKISAENFKARVFNDENKVTIDFLILSNSSKKYPYPEMGNKSGLYSIPFAGYKYLYEFF